MKFGRELRNTALIGVFGWLILNQFTLIYSQELNNNPLQSFGNLSVHKTPLLDINPETFLLLFEGFQSSDISSIKVGGEHFQLAGGGLQLWDGCYAFAVPYTVFNAEGNIILHCDMPVSAQASEWNIYLVPGWDPAALSITSIEAVREDVLVWRQGAGDDILQGDIVLSRAIPFRYAIGYGLMQNLQVYGDEFLKYTFLLCRDMAATFRNVSQDGDATVAEFSDPAAPGNTIRCRYEPMNDRMRITITYTVSQSVDEAVPVEYILVPDKLFHTFKGISWRLPRHLPKNVIAGYIPEGLVFEQGTAGSMYLAFSQTPIVTCRFADGSHMSVVDYDQGNIYAVCERNESGEEALRISSYLWPGEIGRVYSWSFEVFCGYENIFNRTLRAFNPHTSSYSDQMEGAVGNQGTFNIEDIQEPYARGMRTVWYHGWFHRNGKYMEESWPFSTLYNTVWGNRQNSYQQVKSNIDLGHNMGLNIFVYHQFAGVSEDITDEFEPWIVKDADGDPVIAGRDGDYRNIWANPDPQGVYGKAVLDQISYLFQNTEADGIALDRSDRLDFTYGDDMNDFGNFNGYASVNKYNGQRRPVSSITISGGEWLSALRDTLDKYEKELITNVPIHPRVVRLSEAILADLQMDPWRLFYLKAVSNGKSCFAYVKASTGGGNILAQLGQIQPVIGGSISWTHLEERGRLLYAVSENDLYPTVWYFTTGYSRVQFDYDQFTRTSQADSEPETRYQGSAYQSWETIISHVREREGSHTVRTFHLYPNYPNPFNAETTIKIDMPFAAGMHIIIYNILGQVVKTLTDGKVPSGLHTVTWDGTNDLHQHMASGVYICHAKASEESRYRKLVLLK